ncbi:MAG: zinc ribbon domain-containing protein [Thermoplasmata archaeon]
MKCPKCGAETTDYSPFCASCGATIRELEAPTKEAEPEKAPTTYYEYSVPVKYTKLPTIGGILVFLVALGGLIFVIKGLLDILSTTTPINDIELELAITAMIALSVSISTLAAISIIGSFYALARKNFPLSFIGGAASFMVGLLTFGILGAIVAIAGLVLITISKNEIQ